MKYRHYAPRAQVFIYTGDVAQTIRQRYHNDIERGVRPRVLCSRKLSACYRGLDCRELGDGPAGAEQALFAELRRADDEQVDTLYFHYEPSMGEAVANRIGRAADRGASPAL